MIVEFIIPLPEGTKSGGKAVDGFIGCNNECGEVQVVRIGKRGIVNAYCDGKVTLRKCHAAQSAGIYNDFPARTLENALHLAEQLELKNSPREFIELFEKSWNVKLNKEEPTNENNIKEDTETRKSERSPENPNRNPENPDRKTAEDGGNSGISEFSVGDIHSRLYGG